ncbi:MAG: cyanophycinase [Blastomonas sp.]
MIDTKGTLIAIGGHEDKEGERVILSAVAERLRGGRLVVATVASKEPQEYIEAYRKAFGALGVQDIVELYVEDRAQSDDVELQDQIAGAGGVFFTGGDQNRIMSHIGDTPLAAEIQRLHARGGVIAGTSAGASVQSEVMMVSGGGAGSFRVGDIEMAPGLGLISGVIIDQHFAERGRIGRLLGAVAHNPHMLGIGIDEGTAIIVNGDQFTVIGRGGVTVVQADRATRSNIDEASQGCVLSIHDVVMHVLSAGDRFDLANRRPEAIEDN